MTQEIQLPLPLKTSFTVDELRAVFYAYDVYKRIYPESTYEGWAMWCSLIKGPTPDTSPDRTPAQQAQDIAEAEEGRRANQREIANSKWAWKDGTEEPV